METFRNFLESSEVLRSIKRGIEYQNALLPYIFVTVYECLMFWVADTMICRRSKAAVQITIERSTRYTMISKLPAKTAGRMREKHITRLEDIHSMVRKTITFDNGTENAEHETITKELQLKTYFCHPYHSWEKGSVENIIGLIRQHLPKKTDFSEVSHDSIMAIENRLNNRPRKCLGFRTPKEVFSKAVALAS